MNSNNLNTSQNKQKGETGRNAIPDVMKVVEMAQTSGDVLVDVAPDGRVTVRSVREAVSLALKKKLPKKWVVIAVIFSAFCLGSVCGVLTDRFYLHDSFIQDKENLISSSASNETSVLFSEYETKTLLDLPSTPGNNGTRGEDFFLMGDIEAAFVVWKKEIFSLPDNVKVIVTGVYSSEATAFKVYEELARDFRPILVKRKSQNASQILILVPHVDNSNFEETRRRLADKLSIPLPKWNSASTLKNRL